MIFLKRGGKDNENLLFQLFLERLEIQALKETRQSDGQKARRRKMTKQKMMRKPKIKPIIGFLFF